MDTIEPRAKRSRVEQQTGVAPASTAQHASRQAAPTAAERSLALAGAWGSVLAHLSTRDACEVRAVTRTALAQVAAHRWRDLDTAVVRLEKWRACFPEAMGVRLAPSQVAPPLGALAGLESVSLAGWGSAAALAQVTAGAPGVRSWCLQRCSLDFLFEAAAREDDGGGEAGGVGEAAAQALYDFDPDAYCASYTHEGLREAFNAGLEAHIESLRVCRAAVSALHRLSKEEGCSFFEDFDARWIAEALTKHVACESLCEAACWTLAKVDKWMYSRLSDSPAAFVAAAMLAHPSSCKVAAAGCTALASFSISCLSTRSYADKRKAGSFSAAMEAVRVALRNHAAASPLVSSHGAAFLKRLVDFVTRYNYESDRPLGAIWDDMLALLQRRPLAPQLCRDISGVLPALSSSPKEICSGVIEGGGLIVLVDALRDPTADLAACYSLVATLVGLAITTEEAFCRAFVAAGGLQAVVCAVDRVGDGRYSDGPVPPELRLSSDEICEDFQRATAVLLFMVFSTWEDCRLLPLPELGAIRVIVRFLQDFLGQGHGGPDNIDDGYPLYGSISWAMDAPILQSVSNRRRRNGFFSCLPRKYNDDFCFLWLRRLCERCPEIAAEVKRLGGVSGLLWAPLAPAMAPPRLSEPYSRGEDVFALPPGALKDLLDCFLTREVTELRLVSRDAMTHIAGHRWTGGSVQVSDIASWRRSFPRAVGLRVLKCKAQPGLVLTLRDFLFLQGLEHLDISECSTYCSPGLQVLESLRTLKMSRCNLTEFGVSVALKQLGSLRELDISGCTSFGAVMFHNISSLEVLNVSGSSGVVFDEETAQALPHLRSLQLDASTVASSPALRQLASLSTLTVTGSSDFREAVAAYPDWALLGAAVCKCLETRATPVTDGQGRLSVEAEVVLAVLTRHRSSAGVCSAACRALERMFDRCEWTGFDFSDCLRAVAAAVHTHLSSLQVCEDAMAALSGMVSEDRADGVYEEMAPAFETAANAVVAALREHPGSVKLSKHAAVFLEMGLHADANNRMLDALLPRAAAALRSAALQDSWDDWASLFHTLALREDDSLELPRRLHDAGIGPLLLDVLRRVHPKDSEPASDNDFYKTCLFTTLVLSVASKTPSGCEALEAADGVAVLSRCAEHCGHSASFEALKRITIRSTQAQEVFINRCGARILLESLDGWGHSHTVHMASWLLSLCAASDAACASVVQAPYLDNFISLLNERVTTPKDSGIASTVVRRMCLLSPAAREAVLAAGGGEVLRKFQRRLQDAVEANKAVEAGLAALGE